MIQGYKVAVIMPALNEAEAIGPVLAGIDRSLADWVIVGDNGSSDDTAAVAEAAGALVIAEPRRGYGSACMKALTLVPEADILVYLDADGSDDPTEMESLLRPLLNDGADVVIGSRVLGAQESGALTPLQVFGNALTCTLVRWLWGVSYTDLGPFRAIWRRCFDELEMCDPDFGWTIEMQVKAAQRGYKVREVPVTYRVRQAGQSKVSGTLAGSFGAGRRILGYVLAAKARELLGKDRRQHAR